VAEIAVDLPIQVRTTSSVPQHGHFNNTWI
jgi:hypothetical protein